MSASHTGGIPRGRRTERLLPAPSRSVGTELNGAKIVYLLAFVPFLGKIAIWGRVGLRQFPLFSSCLSCFRLAHLFGPRAQPYRQLPLRLALLLPRSLRSLRLRSRIKNP